MNDKKKLIGLIGPSMDQNVGNIDITEYWLLPSALVQPEGMVIDEQNQPVIAIDSKEKAKPNLFLLSEMK